MRFQRNSKHDVWSARGISVCIYINIPESINKRLSTISSKETIFNQSVKPYQEALHKSGYSYKLHYDHTTKHPEIKSKNGKRNRRRNNASQPNTNCTLYSTETR